jgi:hypothetical protein
MLRAAIQESSPRALSSRSSAPPSGETKELKYYEYGVKSLLTFEKIADTRRSRGKLSAHSWRNAVKLGLKYRAVNRELQALRQMFINAQRWGR